MEAGRGWVIALLVVLCLCTVGKCQRSSHTHSQSADTLCPSHTVNPESVIFPEQTSFTSYIAEDSELLVRGTDISSSVFNSGVESVSLSSHYASERVDSSSFVSPSVTFYSTAYFTDTVVDTGRTPSLELAGGFTEASKTGESFEISPSVWSDPQQGLTFKTTALLDSVAASVFWDPTKGRTSEPPSHALPSTPAELDAVTSETSPGESSSSGFFLVEPTSSSSFSNHWVTTNSPAVTGFFLVEPTSSSSFSDHWVTTNSPAVSSHDLTATFSEFFPASTSMFDMNSTQSSIFFPTSGETSVPAFSSSPAGGSAAGTNSTPCADTDSGCVEYRGEDSEQEEEEGVRIKVIVGVACGAILLVVILGVFIGCMLRRRGKMASGSKIDLSSYWDDSVTLSYINGHIEIPKDSADEMISLDNDSFLNSLDSMSFTNTWTSDTSKHTNF